MSILVIKLIVITMHTDNSGAEMFSISDGPQINGTTYLNHYELNLKIYCF